MLTRLTNDLVFTKQNLIDCAPERVTLEHVDGRQAADQGLPECVTRLDGAAW
jgi:hypothetical protein